MGQPGIPVEMLPPPSDGIDLEESNTFILDDVDFSVDDIEPSPIAKRMEAKRTRSSSRRDPSEATAGPPNLGEWQDFFSRILIKFATDWYITLAFRGIDEESLSEREIERLRLSKAERDNIARPFAELSNRSKFMRKHGRTLVASADSFDAFVTLGMWVSRVNRIAKRHKPPKNQSNVRRMPPPKHIHIDPMQEADSNGSAGQTAFNGSGNGRVAGNITIINPGGG
jgi:hypothetical protein